MQQITVTLLSDYPQLHVKEHCQYKPPGSHDSHMTCYLWVDKEQLYGQLNKMKWNTCIIMYLSVTTTDIKNSDVAMQPGVDPGEGHRGQMTPPSEPYLGNQKMMYWYESKLFLYFYKIKQHSYPLRTITHHTPCSMQRMWSSEGG